MAKEKTKNQKKLRAAAIHNAEEDYSGVPHSFVFHRGQIGKNVQQLIQDVKKAMEPYTATSLKVRKKNSLKDFVSVAGPLGVTHFLVFSKTETNVNFKFVRLPRGPTLHFKVAQYSLVKDVVSSLKKHRMHEKQFAFPPLLVLNNFGTQGMHIKVMATMFQNMFPSINVHKVHLNSIRRCILISYNQDTQLLDFRHYSVKVVPVGMSKGVKKLLQEKFPNMSRWEDISELLVKGANLSESEAEQDGEHNITELPQVYAGRGNQRFEQSAVRLTEIGPRMTLQLVKIEEGLNDGKVLYHNYIKKTEEEIMAMLDRREKKLKQKNERKKKQEQNVKRKKAMKEENKKRSLAGMKRKRPEDEDDEVEDPGEEDPADVSEDDDVEYYRQTVGEEPDKDLLLHGKRKKSLPRGKSGPPQKRFKKDPMKQRDASPSSSRRHKSKFSLHKGPKSPKGQSPRPAKKGQTSFRNFEGPKGQSPRSHKGHKPFTKFDGPKGQSPRPGKKGNKQFRKFEGPKGQSPRRDKKGQKQFRNFEGPKGQSPRRDKKGNKQFRNFESPNGQSPRRDKKGQKPFKNTKGRTQNEHPTGKGKKMGFKKPGAFGSKDQNRGKKGKVAGGHKMGGPKGKAFRHKKKSP
ncbi:suppressor of SWI4 1 homolog isoform X1 [Dendrobates tinctorius]|uniref:suppressor of SWI4 1 homolog isoform X1 n=2 Tax=Dendrobates tinctorius TaxID=92724 RepID=UPI003CC9E616